MGEIWILQKLLKQPLIHLFEECGIIVSIPIAKRESACVNKDQNTVVALFTV